jgi:diguanylate cyclase (GGDEF)-like protein/PAS domain S-box-containing protein
MLVAAVDEHFTVSSITAVSRPRRQRPPSPPARPITTTIHPPPDSGHTGPSDPSAGPTSTLQFPAGCSDTSQVQQLSVPPSREEQYFRKVLQQVSDAIVTTDNHGRVTYANPAAETLYGIAEQDAVGRSLTDLLAMFTAEHHGNLDAITAVVARQGRWHGEIAQRSLDGRDLLVEASISLLRDDDGTVMGSASVVREISERKAAERQISYQATHDGLTGLLNRAAFMTELRFSLAADRQPALVFLDLNGFKDINDIYGHDRGDEILQAVAGRLSGTVRTGDAAGRFGGDEFVLLAHDLHDPAAATAYLDRVTAVFADPVQCRNGSTYPVGASMGVAHSKHGDNPDSLLRRADIAMYEAKRSTVVASAYRTAP